MTLAEEEKDIKDADNNDPYIIMKPMEAISKFSFPLFSAGEQTKTKPPTEPPPKQAPLPSATEISPKSQAITEPQNAIESFMSAGQNPPQTDTENLYSIMADTIEASSNFMCIIVNHKIIAINQAGLKLLELKDSSKILNKDITDIIAQEYHALFSDQIASILEKDEDKEEKVLLQVVPETAPPFEVFAGGRFFHNDEGFSFILELIKKAPEQSEKTVQYSDSEEVNFHDDITGLPKASLFEDRVEMAIARAIRNAHGKAENSSELIAIFSIEMDKTKEIEQSFGEEAVIYVLGTLATRLVSSFRKVDSVAKSNNKGFLMSLEHLSSIDDVEIIARRIMGLVKEDINYDDINLALGCSIGISIFPYNAITVKELISQADIALGMVKEEGGDGYAFYTDEQSREKLEEALNKESPAMSLAPKDTTFNMSEEVIEA